MDSCLTSVCSRSDSSSYFSPSIITCNTVTMVTLVTMVTVTMVTVTMVTRVTWVIYYGYFHGHNSCEKGIAHDHVHP